MKSIIITAKFFILAAVICFINTTAYSQLKDKSLNNISSEEKFFVDPLVFYQRDSAMARMDLYLEVPFKNLQFKKNASGLYEADFSYNVSVMNDLGQTVINEPYTESVIFTNKERKENKLNSKFIIEEYLLNPGKYNVRVSMTDNNTNQQKSKERSVYVKDFRNEDVAFSDVMIASRFSQNNNKKVLTPLVNNNVGELKKFYLFFEVYNNNPAVVSNSYTYSIKSNDDKELQRGNLTFTLGPGVNKVIEDIKTDNLLVGDYRLIINNNTGKTVATKDFIYKWTDMPVNINNLDLAIRQTVYIATGNEFNQMKNAKSKQDKEKRFMQFWQTKDPNPNTVKNELMLEYYGRIAIANKRYSHYVDGWKTDMGMVYIIYGEPNNIDRHPFNEGTKPYEVWEYYDMNKQFIFVDNTGFGDYRLTNPIHDDWHRRD